MKYLFSFILALTLSFTFAQQRIIFDTDLGYDVDDVGALAVLHALADTGEAEILATISEVADPYAPQALNVINTYYGRPDIPVGQNSRRMWLKAYPYWRRVDTHFVKDLAENFPHDLPAVVPSAVDVYRQVLAQQPDNSVTVVAVGFLQNLSDLLESGPDRYSALDGRALIRQKVKRLTIMGGSYPRSERDFNLTGGPENSTAATQNVLEAWPNEIVLTPGNVCGGSMSNGQSLSKSVPKNNPIRRAYEVFNDRPNRGRTSWDLCTVLYGVRLERHDGQRYFTIRTDKRLIVDRDKSNRWETSDRPHGRLIRRMDVAELERVLEELLIATPKLN